MIVTLFDVFEVDAEGREGTTTVDRYGRRCAWQVDDPLDIEIENRIGRFAGSVTECPADGFSEGQQRHHAAADRKLDSR